MKKAFILLSIFLTGCSLLFPWRNTYLKEGTGKLTSDEVMQRLGPPQREGVLSDGSVIWSYRYNGSSIDTNSVGHVQGRSSCIEYILTFDKTRVLRSHRRQGC